MKRTTGQWLAACAAVMLAAGTTLAGTYTWDASGGAPLNDGTGNWNATGGNNWSPDGGATYGAWGNTITDIAVFGVANGAGGTITVGTVNANGIIFNPPGSGNYTLSGGTITLDGTTPTITVNTNVSINGTVINAPLGTFNVMTGTATLRANTSLTVQTLLVTNNTLALPNKATLACATFSEVVTLNTSNGVGQVATTVLVASNATFNFSGTWNMNGGVHTIATVATNGTAGTVSIGYQKNAAAVNVNPSAIWDLGNSAGRSLNLTIGRVGTSTNVVLTVNGGIVTNMNAINLLNTDILGSAQVIVTNHGEISGFKGTLAIGNDGGAKNNTEMVTGGGRLNLNNQLIFLGNNDSTTGADARNGLVVSGSGSMVTNANSISSARRGGSGGYLTVTNGGAFWGNNLLSLGGGTASANTATITGQDINMFIKVTKKEM